MRALTCAAALLLCGCPPDEGPGPDDGGSLPILEQRCDKYYGPDVPLRRCRCDDAGRCLDMV